MNPFEGQNASFTLSLLSTVAGGIADGITITLALCGGMWLADVPPATIVTAGCIVAFAVAFVMFTGSLLVEKDIRKDHSKQEIKEWNRVQKLLDEAGFSPEQKQQAICEWEKEKAEWEVVVQTKEARSLQRFRIWFTGTAYLVGGLIPATLIYLLRDDPYAFRVCLAVSFTCLITAGYIREKASHAPTIPGVLRTIGIAIAALGMAAAVSRLFIPS